MVLLAIFVSRFEAIVVAGMLRGYGLHVSLDAEAHASVEYISLALGGHRLRVMQSDYVVASQILRQAGALEPPFVEPVRNRALAWVAGILAVFYALSIGSSVLAGGAPLSSLLYIPLGVYSVPVDPKGRPDYFLAREKDGEGAG